MKVLKGKGLLLSFLILILVTWASPAYVAEKSYKIGVNLEFTGPWAEVTKTMKNTMVLEVERINKMGGIDGHPLELIFEDNGFDLSKGRSQYDQVYKRQRNHRRGRSLRG